MLCTRLPASTPSNWRMADGSNRPSHIHHAASTHDTQHVAHNSSGSSSSGGPPQSTNVTAERGVGIDLSRANTLRAARLRR